MFLIPCPHCGPRDQIEFRCGGQAHVERPDPAPEADARAWADYLFFRDNPKGPALERWVHEAGCGQWFNVARDTVTHEFLRVYPMGEGETRAAAPAAGQPEAAI
ncbi:MAG: sarcosine oxidase subunit delta [Sphingomonas sp.]